MGIPPKMENLMVKYLLTKKVNGYFQGFIYSPPGPLSPPVGGKRGCIFLYI
jgi:hypothetical protein